MGMCDGGGRRGGGANPPYYESILEKSKFKTVCPCGSTTETSDLLLGSLKRNILEGSYVS